MTGRARILPRLTLLVALTSAGAAGAQPKERSRAELFEQLGAPGAQRATALAAQAALLLAEADSSAPSDWETVCRTTLALRTGSDSVSALRGKARALEELARDAMRAQARIEAAIQRLELARALAPNDPALIHAHAGALAHWQELGPAWECSVTRRDEEAIALLEQLAERHPSYAPERVAFELGVLLTRSSRFEEATAAYARADALSLDGDTGIARANLAETQMLSGDLDAAIAGYSHALERAQQGSGHALAVWGLAVALERSGDHARAVERLQRAFGAGGEGLLVLRGDGVFFVPAYEIHAYEALGHEARAAMLATPAEQSAQLRAAATSHRAFLAGAAHAGRLGAPMTRAAAHAAATAASYEATAREGLARVLKKLEALVKEDRKAKRAGQHRPAPSRLERLTR
jgi:tetratricopeptide (TPR) repeat protein